MGRRRKIGELVIFIGFDDKNGYEKFKIQIIGGNLGGINLIVKFFREI